MEPLGHRRLSPEVWTEIFAHLPILWRTMCCRVCKAWHEDLEQPQQGHGDDILVDYGLGTLCSVLATKGVDEVMRRIHLHHPSGIPADLGRMDQVRRFVQRHRWAKIETVNEWMQVASQEPDAGWLCKGASKAILEGMGKSLMRQDVGKPQEFSKHLETLMHSAMAVSFSPDGGTIASAGFDWAVRLFDTKTMEEKGTLTGHSQAVSSVAYSPDGSTIASGSWDTTVRLWDAKTMKQKGTLRGHSAEVNSVAFSPDSKFVASGSGRYGEVDNSVRIWEVSTGYMCCMDGNSDSVSSVAYSPDGSTIASGSWDGTVRLWDARTMKQKGTLIGHSSLVVYVAYSPDGTHIATASTDEMVKIWGAVTMEEKGTLRGHRQEVTCVAYSPDGKRIASASKDKTVRIWDAVTMEEVCSLKGHLHIVSSVAYSPDGSTIASSGWDKTVRLWAAETKKDMGTPMGHKYEVSCVAYSPDRTHIATASVDRTVKIWDAETKQEVCSLRGHRGEVKCIAYSPDGKRIVSGSADRGVKVWDAETQEVVRSLRGHRGEVICVAYSTDGKRIASASNDKTVKVWDAATMEEVCSLRGSITTWPQLVPETEALAVGVTQGRAAGSNITGQYIVTASGDMVYVYRTDSARGKQGEPLACFLTPGPVATVSCQGTSVVVGCHGGQVSRYLLCGASAAVFLSHYSAELVWNSSVWDCGAFLL